MSAKQSAVTRRTPTSSKRDPQQRADRLGGVAAAAVRRVQGVADLGLRAGGLRADLGLGPGVLDAQHQVADHGAVELDDERVGEPLAEARPPTPPRSVGRPVTHSATSGRLRKANVAAASRGSAGRIVSRSVRTGQAMSAKGDGTGSWSRVQRRTREPVVEGRQLGWPVVKTFEELWSELSEKARTRPDGSGTVAQLDAGVHAIGKKLVEEAAESWMAAEHEGRDRAAEEISQLIYHVQVLMLALDLDLDDVYTHL